MKKNNRIALVTTWFPPQKSIAVNRMESFAEFLSEQFEVEVFALNDKKGKIFWKNNIVVHYSTENKLIKLLKSSTKDGKLKHKLKTALRVILFKIIKNPLKSWRKETLKSLKNSHLNQSFDYIISSYAPADAHLVAFEMKKLFPNIRWIADMRDEMSLNPGINAKRKSVYESLESEINKHAFAILSVSKPILDDFKKLCPNVRHFLEIRNGYNHSFQPNIKKIKNEIFTLAYFGSFYGGRKPVIFFQALEELLKEKNDFDFRLDIVGAHQNFDIPKNILQKVKLFPPLAYEKVIIEMAKKDANTIIHPRSSQKGVFTGKLFDYLSVQRPVLALVDKDDVAADLIIEFKTGEVGECNDLEDNKRAIYKLFCLWKNNTEQVLSEENRLSLHREVQLKKLVIFIKNNE